MNRFHQFRVAPDSKVELGEVDAGPEDMHGPHKQALPTIEACNRNENGPRYPKCAEGKRSPSWFR